MSGKENTENFEDDFDFDALDGDDTGLDIENGEDGSFGDDGGSETLVGTKKKSSGGLVFGVLVLALLGGGSWYALQAGLIPGMGSGSMAKNQDNNGASPNVMPADDNDSASIDGLDGLPPMPDTNMASDLSSSEAADLSTDEDTVSIEMGLDDADGISSSAAVEEDTVLTPMPDVAEGLDDVELTDLDGDLSELEGLNIPNSAERDGVSVSGSDMGEEIELAETELLNETEKTIDAVEDSVEDAAGTLQENELMTGLFADDAVEEDSSQADTALDVSDEDIADLLGEDVALDEPEAVDSPETTTSVPEEAEASDVNASEGAVVNEDTMSADGDDGTMPEKAEASPEKADMDAQPMKEESAAEPSETKGMMADTADAVPAEPEKAEKAEDLATSAVENKTEPVAAEPKKPVVLPKWKLRSAKPGSAVLYDSRTGGVKTVETGDVVRGLGRIKSISKVGGKWLVDGTQGDVSQ